MTTLPQEGIVQSSSSEGTPTLYQNATRTGSFWLTVAKVYLGYKVAQVCPRTSSVCTGADQQQPCCSLRDPLAAGESIRSEADTYT